MKKEMTREEVSKKIEEDFRVVTTLGTAKFEDKGEYYEDQLGRRMPKRCDPTPKS